MIPQYVSLGRIESLRVRLCSSGAERGESEREREKEVEGKERMGGRWRDVDNGRYSYMLEYKLRSMSLLEKKQNKKR